MTEQFCIIYNVIKGARVDRLSRCAHVQLAAALSERRGLRLHVSARSGRADTRPLGHECEHCEPALRVLVHARQLGARSA